MTNRTHAAIVLLALALESGCGDASLSPTALAPSPVPTTAAPPPPRSYDNGYTLQGVALSGVVFEVTPDGLVPLADVTVYCDPCGVVGHTWVQTDIIGAYSFSGDLDSGGGIWLSSRPTSLWVKKDGYRDPPGTPPSVFGSGWRDVMVATDTRFDISLVRQ